MQTVVSLFEIEIRFPAFCEGVLCLEAISTQLIRYNIQVMNQPGAQMPMQPPSMGKH